MPDLPDFNRKRKILFSKKTTKEELISVGNAFLEQEYFDDALEFFTRAEALEEVRKVERKAFEPSDACRGV